jgi:hypothetical protein
LQQRQRVNADAEEDRKTLGVIDQSHSLAPHLWKRAALEKMSVAEKPGATTFKRQARKSRSGTPEQALHAQNTTATRLYDGWGAFAAMFHGRSGAAIAATPSSRPISRHTMDTEPEPKTPAEMKEIRLNRKLAQDAEGVKAMADIAAADIAIRKRTESLRAARLAREEEDRAKPVEPKPKKKKTT